MLAAAAPPAVPLNSPTVGSNPATGTVLPSKLTTVKPPQARPHQQHASGGSGSGGGNSSSSSSSGSSTSSSGSSISGPPPLVAPLRVPALPHWFVVFYALIKDTDGRDKALKALQYGMRYVRWLMKQSPHRTQQVMAVLIAVAQLAIARSPSTPAHSKQQQVTDTATARLPSAHTSTTSITTTAAPGASPTVTVPLLLSHITIPLSLVDHLAAAITQRLDLLSGTFSTIRKGIRLFKW